MPHLYGGDAVRVLKADAQTKNIPVVFLTAVYNDKSPEGEESKGINVAGHDYPSLDKPFPAKRLISIINQNLL